MFRLSARFTLNLNGTESLELGRMGSPCCILIEKLSCEDTLGLSATFSVQHRETPMQLLILTLRSGNVMSKAHIDSMIAIRSNFLFSRKCFKLVLGLALVNVLQGLFLHPLRLPKGLRLSVRTGTLDSATTRALIGASMVPVLNVEVNTERKTLNRASPLSTLDTEKELAEGHGEGSEAAAGPRSFSSPFIETASGGRSGVKVRF
jgi:hypothetical protein